MDNERKRRKKLKNLIEEHLQIYSVLDQRKHKAILVKVLMKLPPDVAEKIFFECIFIVLTVQHNFHKQLIYINIAKSDFERQKNDVFRITYELNYIILDFRNIPDAKKENFFVHEIAHYILGHTDPSCTKNISLREEEAADLIRSWGFDFISESNHHFVMN